MGSGGSTLALLAAGELGKVTVVVTLPMKLSECGILHDWYRASQVDIHLVVEHLGLARLGLGDERIIKDIEHVLADLLKLRLDLLAVLADDGDVLLGSLLFFLLLDRRDDTPRCTAGTDDVLVGD